MTHVPALLWQRFLAGGQIFLGRANLPALGANLPNDKESKARSRQFDSAHFGGFGKSLREVFGDIFQSFLDIDFALG